jgi:hypothetical protein
MSETATTDAPVVETITPEAASAHNCTWALLLDLEFAAVDGVQALRSAYATALADAGITLTDAQFSRFLLGETVTDGVSALLNHLKQPKDKAAQLVAAVNTAFNGAIVGVPVRPTVKALLKLAAERNGLVTAVTSLDTDLASEMLKAIGLPEETAVLETKSEGCGYHGTETWVRLARGTHLTERHCMAVTATADSARSALMANVNVSVFTGPLTEHQDFGGVDCIGTGHSAKEADAIVETVLSRI